MARACGHRLLRFVGVCVVIALMSLLVLPSRWSTPHEAITTWVAAGGGSGPRAADDQSPGNDELLFLVPSGDNGRLELPVADILMPGLVPPDVHFVWCGERWFEFKNYLSVMSVRRTIQPDKIYIHYERVPPLDRVYYHQVSRRSRHQGSQGRI